MKKLPAILSIILITSFVYACSSDKKKTIKTTKVTFTKEGELELYSLKDTIPAKIMDLDIEIADDEYQIQTGLMYRKSMLDNRGMLFIFPEERERYFYMKNTEISLDLIYINAKNKVVSIQKNAKPFDESSLPSNGPAQYVLEVNAGLTDKWNVKAGDSISYRKL